MQLAMGRGGLSKVLELVAGPEAYLAELGALVAFPGAIRQPVHPALCPARTLGGGGGRAPVECPAADFSFHFSTET